MSAPVSFQRRCWRRLSVYFWWSLAILLIILAAYVVVGRQLMSMVPDYRERFVAVLEERLGTPLSIAELDGEMAGVVPRFSGRQISLSAPKGQAPLVLDEVVAELDMLASLWRRDLVLRSLRIRGVDLHLVRNEQGKMHLRGLEHLGEQAAEQGDFDRQTLFDVLYRQRQILIEDARFSVQWPGLPELAASSLDVAFVQHPQGPQLSLKLQARDRPLAVTARLHLEDRPRQLSALNGRVYIKVEGERLHEWLPAQRDWPLDLSELDGTIQLWSQIRGGEPGDGQIHLQVPGLTLSDGLQSWPFSNVRLNLALSRSEQQATLALHELAGQSPAGTLNLGQASMQWQTQGSQRHWLGRAEDVPLHAVSQQLEQWPFALPDGLNGIREQLTRLRPRGVLEGALWEGHGDSLEHLQGRFNGLHTRAVDSLPGLQGVSGWLAGGADQGLVQLSGDNVRLALPSLYAHTLQGAVDGLLTWQREDGALQIRSNRLQVVNSDAQGEALFALRLPPSAPPELALMARISEADVARAAHYIPMKVLHPNLADWLQQAFRGGRLRQGQILFQGLLGNAAGLEKHRTLQMRYQGDEVALSFLAGWPQATGAAADVLIRDRKVSGVASRARLFDTEGRQIYVDIAPHPHSDVPTLVLSAELDGPVDDIDTLLQKTPLREVLPAELLDWRFAGGRMQGQLLLSIPLAPDQPPPMLIADGRIANTRVENLARRLTLEKVSAPLYLHLRDGIQVERFSAESMGGALRGQWHTRDGSSRLQVEGEVPVTALRQWLGFPWLSPLSGRIPLGLDIAVPWQGQPFSLQAASSLQGVVVDLPAPMGKTAQQTLPFELSLSGEGDNQQLQLRYADRLRAALRLEQQLSGELVVGEGSAPRLAGEGINVRGNLGEVSALPWLEYISNELIPALNETTDNARQGASATALSRVTLSMAQLDLFELPIPQATFSALPGEQGTWNMAISSDALAASLVIPADYQARGDTPLQLSVSRLDVSLPVLQETTAEKAVRPRPRDIPVMDVRLQTVRINGEDYGQWRGDVRATDSGIRVDDLYGLWRQTRIDGELQWRSDEQGGGQYSQLNGSLSSTNLGRSLVAWDLPAFVESGDAVAKVVLGWNDWPLDMDYLALQGQARIDIGECRIPETDSRASLLRVLGILNVGNIQRRLRLDFSDLYRKGLSCDSISGDFSIDGPRVSTSNLTIDSPSAAIRARGDVDLAAQTLDHELRITLPLSSNLYAGCLAGPAACAGIFVVERIWGDRLDKTTTMDYRVRGPLQDPRVSEQGGEGG